MKTSSFFSTGYCRNLTIIKDRASRTLMSLGILLDASGTTAHGASDIMVPSGPILMKDQLQPTVHFVSGNSPHLSNTPVPPVRSQPILDGSAGGNVQVTTMSRMHIRQEVNLNCLFFPSCCISYFLSHVGRNYWMLIGWDRGHFFLNQERSFGNQEGMITWCWLVSRFKQILKRNFRNASLLSFI